MNATGWMEYVLVFSTQRGNLKLLAIATPHQSFLPIGSEVPLVKKSSFPPGEAKGRLRELIPFNVPIHSGNGGWLRIPIIYKLFTPAIVLAMMMQTGFRAATNREPTYWYMVRSVVKKM